LYYHCRTVILLLKYTKKNSKCWKCGIQVYLFKIAKSNFEYLHYWRNKECACVVMYLVLYCIVHMRVRAFKSLQDHTVILYTIYILRCRQQQLPLKATYRYLFTNTLTLNYINDYLWSVKKDISYSLLCKFSATTSLMMVKVAQLSRLSDSANDPGSFKLFLYWASAFDENTFDVDINFTCGKVEWLIFCLIIIL